MEKLEYSHAKFDDQGKLGPLLLDIFGETLTAANSALAGAGMEATPAEDICMAADDFYFSTLDLMDCCWFAREGGKIVGAAAANPFTAELQYVAVLPEYRRRGVGSKLFRLIAKALANRGCGHIKITVGAGPDAAAAAATAFLQAVGLSLVSEQKLFGKKLEP